jgi:hypothetical protein
MRLTPHGGPGTYEYRYAASHPPRRAAFARLARMTFVLGLEAAAAFALISVISGPSPAPAEDAAPAALQADAVAAAPADFRAGQVTVEGRVRPRPTRVAPQDRYAFVLEGARDGRLLAVPAKGVRLPAYTPGVKVVVRGDVVVPPDSKRLAKRVSSRTAVAQRADATAIVKVAQVELAP